MTALFGLYREDGSVILDSNSKPLGTNYKPTVLSSSVTSASLWTFMDPETKATTRNYCELNSLSFIEDGHVLMFRLVDKVPMIFNASVSTYVYKLGNHNASSPVVCVETPINMISYLPTDINGDLLKVYDETGNLSWSLNAITRSVQLIEAKTFEISDTATYGNSTYYVDIPDYVDLSKVFIVPCGNSLPYVNDYTSGGIAYEEFITLKLVGRRLYALISLHEYVNTYVANSVDSLSNNIKKTTGVSKFSVGVFFIPNAS